MSSWYLTPIFRLGRILEAGGQLSRLLLFFPLLHGYPALVCVRAGSLNRLETVRLSWAL
jgi:hypothetical protein